MKVQVDREGLLRAAEQKILSLEREKSKLQGENARLRRTVNKAAIQAADAKMELVEGIVPKMNELLSFLNISREGNNELKGG